MTAWEETAAAKWGRSVLFELEGVQRTRVNLFREWLDFFSAAATTGQRGPFQPIRLFGWAPGWTE